jgi:signal transduction histidine kinase
VLLNLLNNAFYSVNEKRKISTESFRPKVIIRTSMSGPGKEQPGIVQVIIADNGNGIPPSLTDKIFQPFFTTKPTGDGTGLGLSLSYDIITNAHSGALTVESKEGEGAEFTIQIPVV